MGRMALGFLLCQDWRCKSDKQGCNRDRLLGGATFETAIELEVVGVVPAELHLADTVILPTMPAW